MWPFSIPFSINNFYIFHSKFIVWSRSFISERERMLQARENVSLLDVEQKTSLLRCCEMYPRKYFVSVCRELFWNVDGKNEKVHKKIFARKIKKILWKEKFKKFHEFLERERVKLNWNEKFWHFVTNNEVPKYQRSFTTHRYDSGALKLSENLKSTRTLCMI